MLITAHFRLLLRHALITFVPRHDLQHRRTAVEIAGVVLDELGQIDEVGRAHTVHSVIGQMNHIDALRQLQVNQLLLDVLRQIVQLSHYVRYLRRRYKPFFNYSLIQSSMKSCVQYLIEAGTPYQ